MNAGPTSDHAVADAEGADVAVRALRDAIESRSQDVSLWSQLAGALRRLGRPTEEKSALEHLLTLQPNNFEALLRMGAVHEDTGDSRTAAAIYRSAVAYARQGVALLPQQRAALDHANAVVAANDVALESYLEGRLAGLRSRHADGGLLRFDRTMATLLRKRRVYRPVPSFLYVPNLPAIEFFEREDFPWLASIEMATDDIREELLAVIASASSGLQPYITTRGTPGVTVQKAPDARWSGLNDSPRWSSYFFWQEGVAYQENIARCPKTVAALAAWPRCDLPRTGPTAMFSLLAANTRIPPHTGVTNARLVVHIPLIVPPGCGFRVGAETREWEPGKALIFDDTIEHEAWNNSDQLRAVLIIDIWNPFLTPAERDLVGALTEGVGEYYGSLPSYA